jgi:hypothetical protein
MHRRHLALAGALLGTLVAASGAPAATVVSADADSWTNARQPARAYGGHQAMRANAKPRKRMFVRFTVESLPEGAESVVLRVYARTGAPRGLRVFTTGTRWSERRLTHRNAPKLRTRVAKVAPFDARGTWRTIDLTSTITGPGTYAFALRAPKARTDVVLVSKEGGRAPQLVIAAPDEEPPDPGPTAVAPANTSLPAVSGAAREGESLSSTLGSWTGTAPISHARQWRRCNASGASCADVSGRTGASYAVGAADVGSTLRVRVTASNAAGSATATSAATAVVQAAPSPPPGEPVPGTTITTTSPWNCTGNISSFGPLPIKVISTIPNPGTDNAINLRGCYGDGNPATIDLILDVRGNGSTIGTAYDAVRVGQNARDLVVTGNVECGGRWGGIHQDIVQALSGSNITFVDFTSGDPDTGRWTCWGAGGGWYVNWANGSIPTDLVCVRCKLATYNQNMRIDEAVRSGARDSVFGYSRAYGIFIGPLAVDPINQGNRVVRY